jgi:hypothetical protein
LVLLCKEVEVAVIISAYKFGIIGYEPT